MRRVIGYIQHKETGSKLAFVKRFYVSDKVSAYIVIKNNREDVVSAKDYFEI